MTITWEIVLTVCGGFAVIMGALHEIAKIIELAKKPGAEIEKKLQRDYDRINQLESEIKDIKDGLQYIKDSLRLQMETDMVMLEHMRTNNATGKISEQEGKYKKFLLEHQKSGEV